MNDLISAATKGGVLLIVLGLPILGFEEVSELIHLEAP